MQRKPKQQPFSSISHECYRSVVGSFPNTPHAHYGHGCWSRIVLFSGHGQQICSCFLAIKNTVARFFSTAHCASLCHLPPIACFHFQIPSHDVLTFSHHFLALPIPTSDWDAFPTSTVCFLSYFPPGTEDSPKSLPNHFILFSQTLFWGKLYTAMQYVPAPPFASAHFLPSAGLLAPWDWPHCSNHKNGM